MQVVRDTLPSHSAALVFWEAANKGGIPSSSPPAQLHTANCWVGCPQLPACVGERTISLLLLGKVSDSRAVTRRGGGKGGRNNLHPYMDPGTPRSAGAEPRYSGEQGAGVGWQSHIPPHMKGSSHISFSETREPLGSCFLRSLYSCWN